MYIILLSILVVLLFNIFFYRPYIGYGPSMLPTLVAGDIGIKKVTMFGLNDPTRGDLISFRFPTANGYMKRLIGMPGDTLLVVERQLYVNGELSDFESKLFFSECMAICPCTKMEGVDIDLTVPLVVPEGHFFVLGDNRNSSTDSRHFGFVPRNKVEGKLVFIVVSIGRDGVRWDRSWMRM